MYVTSLDVIVNVILEGSKRAQLNWHNICIITLNLKVYFL